MSQMTTVAPATTPNPPAAPAPTATRNVQDLHAIVQNVLGDLVDIFICMDWAEEEIAASQKQHPREADLLFHAFKLLTPRHDKMSTEFVFRSHCRELLDRLRRGADTRPGTAAEVCCVMVDTSLRAPLRSSAAGLYMRMWADAGFPEIEEFTAARGHHEALERRVMDDHEQYVRRSLAVPSRRLTDPTCKGLHHGEPAVCRFATPEQLTLT